MFTSKAGPGGQALWCLCRIPAGDKVFSLSHMVKWWVLDLGEEWGKTTTKAEFLSGVAVNEVVLKGSWPLRCRGEGAGPWGVVRRREEEASGLVLITVLCRMVRSSVESAFLIFSSNLFVLEVSDQFCWVIAVRVCKHRKSCF